MRKKHTFIKRYVARWISAAVALSMIFSLTAYATEDANETKHYLGTVANAGHDTGFSKNNTISDGDPHFGWELGKFYINGYTRVSEDKNGDPVFLKTVGDTVTLWFELEQDITKLNGDESLSVASDDNGYDEYFGVEKTNMGHGALIIRHTDYQNQGGDPIIYTNYLEATAAQNAAVEVELCEEGDYEVALDYELVKKNLDVFGWDPVPSYNDYRIFFRFSVRNGNCMVYPFDTVTGAELTNSSITENGFYLDLAKSRYLNVDIKKEVRKEGAEGLTEDVRFNKPAKDGEKYTDEGIYTITVSNQYTNQTTTKVIYVGTDDVLKAHVATGLSISDVEQQLLSGATVADDGTLIPADDQSLSSGETATEPDDNNNSEEGGNVDNDDNTDSMTSAADDISSNSTPIIVLIFIGAAIILAIIAIIIITKIKNKEKAHTADKTESNSTDDDDDNGGDRE